MDKKQFARKIAAAILGWSADYAALQSDNEVADAILAIPQHHAFRAGFNLGASFTPAGGALTGVNGGASTSKTGAGEVTAWDWKENVDKLDVTHSGTAGIQALIAGVLRGQGNIKCNFDSASMLWATAGGAITAGTKGVFNLNLNSSNTDWVIPGMIVELHGKTEVAGKLELDFSFELDTLSGAYTRPT